ncbi:MAG: TrpB-like pyridoxal-phosphate dependent enzyme, partial [Thermodesulfovibrio sp.]|nr:TrpB-like pyridoxal-phosphate dependent enzyme [Thermodesulfovibrio sp.]
MRRVILSERDLPKYWYNIQADMPKIPPPPLNSKTGKPITADELKIIFPMSLIEQEVSRDRWIPIPDEVLKIYASFRPTPLHRAIELERVLQTPAK